MEGEVKKINCISDNRALNTTRKTDKIKDITIGLEDIDSALMYYFKNIIKPTVVQDGNRIDVQIMYGSIVIPDAGKDRNEHGTVIAVGPGTYTIVPTRE